ncbi:hypothetical protein [Flavihumibacter fluvii]|uniref:hypothetical protein n=1 Tax=Flavihumibacter fluvii TaxID=2838157 RepID=UPI001BDEF8E1|nr:hypothetical protein [Flavihumibacter fluvii]ULQ51284.1 hypothetical protein KJS93_14430 [Flavihumibacter fluvii]
MNNLFRYSLTLVILLSLCAQHAGKLLLVADYYTNTSSYLANCENKSRPQLHCNGQCLLMKKMQKAERKDAQAPGKKLDWKIEVLSRKSFYSPINSASQDFVRHYCVPHTTGAPVDFTRSFFHPPSVA